MPEIFYVVVARDGSSEEAHKAAQIVANSTGTSAKVLQVKITKRGKVIGPSTAYIPPMLLEARN